jgi:HEAT repeat protein
MRKILGMLVAAFLACATAGAADVQALVKGLNDPSPDVRAEAWKTAGEAGAEAVAPLADLLAAQDPEVSIAAAKALDNIADFVSRPGAQKGRPAVAAELAKLLDPAKAPVVRTTAVRLLALCGGDAEARAVANLLTDSDATLADDARVTLQQMPGYLALRALMDAMPKVQPPMAANIATAFGQRKYTGAIPALKAAVASGEASVKWASLDALARMGVAPVEAMARPEGGAAEDLARWDNARLVAASNSDPAKAVELLKQAAANSQEDFQVGAALQALQSFPKEYVPMPETFVPLAVAALARPGARATAVRRLVAEKAVQVEPMLASAFDRAEPAAQAALLQVFADRKSETLAKALETAKQSPAPEVRLAAAEASGEAPAADLLFETIEKGSDWSRNHASELILAQAKDAEGKDAAVAQALYERILRSPLGSKPKREVFAGLERLARVESLPLLDEFVAPLYQPSAPVSPAADAFLKSAKEDSALAVAASRAYVVVHAAQGKDQGMPVLLAVLGTMPSYDLSSLAIDKLAEMGVDPQALARSKGFLTNWQALGPFPNENNSAFEQAIVPEGDQPLPESVGDVKRVDAQTAGLPAILDLRGTLHPTGPVVGYAYAEFNSDSEKPVIFNVASDDGCSFWVNGVKLETVATPRGLIPDSDKLNATLRPGLNRVLIKVFNAGGDWAFCVRVTDPAGAPIDLNK